MSQVAVQQLRSGLPKELQSLPRFLLYRLTPRSSGRAGKVPQRLVSGRLLPTSPLSERAWLSLGDALDLLRQGWGDGLGLALCQDAGLVAGLWAIAGSQLGSMLREALASVSG